MLTIFSFVFVVVASVASLTSASDLQSASAGRTLRGHTQDKTVYSSNATQGSLLALGNSCRCFFSGLCSCVQALEFMKCISDACDSGACDCQKHHYFYACKTMSSECPSAGLKCAAEESTCKKVPPIVTESAMELVADIQVMQQRRCKLQAAVNDGWMNGRARLDELEPEIQERTELLSRKGVEVPELGCSAEDVARYKEFKAGLEKQKETEDKRLDAVEANIAEAKLAARRQRMMQKRRPTDEIVAKRISSSSSWHHQANLPEAISDTSGAVVDSSQEVAAAARWDHSIPHFNLWSPLGRISRVQSCLLTALVNLAIATCFAWAYNKYRFRPNFLFAPKSVAGYSSEQEDDFGVSLFGCLSDIKLTLFTCCCPCLRWADSVDKAGLMKYWSAFAAFAVLVFLSPCTFGIAGLLVAFLCYKQRLRLRSKYGVKSKPMQDCLAHFFCSICAIVQESRVVEIERSRG